MEFKTISAEEFVTKLASGKALNILDVRNAPEHAEKHLLTPHKHMPVGELNPKNLWDKKETIYILCGGGKRATRAASTLTDQGFENAIVVTGGLRSCITNGAEISGNDVKSSVICKSS